MECRTKCEYVANCIPFYVFILRITIFFSNNTKCDCEKEKGRARHRNRVEQKLHAQIAQTEYYKLKRIMSIIFHCKMNGL